MSENENSEEFFTSQARGAGLNETDAQAYAKERMERIREIEEQADIEQKQVPDENRVNSPVKPDMVEIPEERPIVDPLGNIEDVEVPKEGGAWGDALDASQERLQELIKENEDFRKEHEEFEQSWLIRDKDELEHLKKLPEVGYLFDSAYAASIDKDDQDNIDFWQDINTELLSAIKDPDSKLNGSMKGELRNINKVIGRHVRKLEARGIQEKRPYKAELADAADEPVDSSDVGDEGDNSSSTPESAGQGGGGDGGNEDTPAAPPEDEDDDGEDNENTPDPLPFDPLTEETITPIEFDNLDTEAVRTGRQEVHPQAVEVNVDTKTDLQKSVEGIENMSPERQRELVRTVLDKIESSSETLKHPENMEGYSLLKESLPSLDPEVRREVEARLHLHAVVTGLSKISGKTEDVVAGLRNLVNELAPKGAKREDRLILNGKDFDTLFAREGLGGDISVAKAYKLILESAKEGLNVNGETLFYKGRMTERQSDAFADELLNRMDGDKTAIFLAERLLVATYEMSVLNTEAPPDDPFSQAIYFEKYRREKKEDYGPVKTVEWIPGFGTSYLRWLRIQKESVFNADLYQQTKRDVEEHSKDRRRGEEKQYNARGPYMRAIRLVRNPSPGTPSWEGNQPLNQFILDVDNVTFADADENSYIRFLAGYVPGILKTKDLLLKSDWKPQDLTIDEIQSWVVPFKNADPDDTLRLKYYFLYGVFSSSWSDRNRASQLLWSQAAWRNVAANLRTPLSDDEDTNKPDKPFIDRKILNKVIKRIAPARSLVGVSPKKF